MTHNLLMHHFNTRCAAFSLIAALILGLSPPVLADDESAAEHVLQAEIALHGNEYLKAASEYRKAAELSDSVEIARQATRLAFNFGFSEEAVIAAQKWVALDPDSDEALIHLAQIQLRLGDVRDSRRSFTKLIERSDHPPDEQLFRLMSFITQEDPADADKLMRALAKPYRDSALAQYCVAAVAMQADDLEFAMETAQRAIELDPEWLKVKLLYARAMLLSGKVDEAIDYTARIIGDDSDPDPDARMELALLYMTAGREDDALSQVNQILLERASRTDALRMMAIINFRQNNLDAAWDDFEDLLASGDYTADALFYLAQISDFRGEHDRAIRLYSQVMAGKRAVASQRRAAFIMAYQKHDVSGAIERLDSFAEQRPNLAIDIVLVKAQLLSSLGEYEDALRYFDKALEYRPDEETVALSRAELMLRLGRLDESISAYRAAAKKWPDSAMTLNALGYTLADRTDEYREAEKLIRKALKYDPKSPAIIDSLGWVLHKRGKNDEALLHLEIAYAGFPDHEVAAHLIEVLVALERNEQASQLLSDATTRNPDSELLEDVRERLFPESP